MLSASTTDFPATVARRARRPPSRVDDSRAWWQVPAKHFYIGLIVVSLVIAALSLLIPSTPSYDPWAWLVWGREIVHLDLHTTGGPSWKPLPMLFTRSVRAVRQRRSPTCGWWSRAPAPFDGGGDGVQGSPVRLTREIGGRHRRSRDPGAGCSR